MKKSLSRWVHVYGATAMAALLVAYPASTIPSNSARVLSQPGLPVKIEDARLKTNIVTRTGELNYDLYNRSKESVLQVKLLIMVLGSRNELKAVQKVCQPVDLSPGESKSMEFTINNLLYRPPTSLSRLVLAVEGGVTTGGAWSIGASTNNLVAAARFGRVVPSVRLFASLASPQTSPQCGEDWCKDCKKDAVELCGSRGTSSYSCSRGTTECNCSLGCGVPPEEPPQN